MKRIIFLMLIIVLFLIVYTKQDIQHEILKNTQEIKIEEIVKFNHNVYPSAGLKDNNFTILIWLNSETNYPWNSLLSMGDDKDNYIQLSLNGTDYVGNKCGINFAYKSKDKLIRVFSEMDDQIITGIYNQIALTYNGDELSIYLNGKKISSKFCDLNFENFQTEKIMVGKSMFFNDPEIKGEYNVFYILDNVLTEKEIKKDFDSRFPNIVLDTLSLSYVNDLKVVWLPENPYHGYYISYYIEENDYVVLDGYKIERIKDPDDDITIKIKMVIENEGNYYERIIHLPVLSKKTVNLEEEKNWFNNSIGAIIDNNSRLPLEKDGDQIQWSIVQGNVEIVDGIIKKTSAEEIETCIIKAEISNRIYEFNVNILDEYVGYIMSYFNGVEGKETANLAYSYDGLHWMEIPNSEGFLKTELGTQRIRDPFITRKKDGTFVILATQGFNNDSIYYWDSKDLIQFDNHKLVQVSFYDSNISMSGERAWAPETYYNLNTDEYYIIFSDTGNENGGMYYITTHDFKSYSYPKRYFYPGYISIDGTIVEKDGFLWLFYKDERDGAITVFYAKGTDAKSFDEVYDSKFISLVKAIEGPFAFETIDEEKVYLYVDNYPNHEFYVSEVDLNDGLFTWLDKDQYTLPEKSVRHCSIIKVTEKEMNQILNYYK